MGLDFPNAPVLDEQFAPVGLDKVFTWNGVRWVTGGSGGSGGTSGGTGGASSGAGGTLPNGGGAGTTGGSAGTKGGSAGAVNMGGMAGGGMSGSAGAAAGSGPGGGMGGEGAGAAGMAGMAGASGGSGLHGGASGKYVCTPGATYGNPLTGMGSVGQIGPPTQGTPNFFAFVEGPVWIASQSKLYFSDNAGSPERIWVVSPGGMPSVFLEKSGSNGMALDSDDKLVVADQAAKNITRVDPTAASPSASLIVAAGCKPNDVIVRSDGNIYWSAPQESGTGFYRMAPNKMVTGPRTDTAAPNGIVLSPDENTLYVGDVQNKKIIKVAVDADGALAATAMPFASTMNGTVDGMCVDCAGNVYAGTSNGVEVYSPDGTMIGTVPTGESSNCTFGGADRKTLYVTSRAVLKTVTLAVPGLPD
ncbi:MAG TPA: SMP-30/gluconolactonase/LRE family protein [Polyangiaceae bacterium]|nr:SMP-30/gluconolactonase/LRE family protein [Polyangiaceae bacterium]